MSDYRLLTPPDNNAKIAKGMKRGVMTFALHLAPADLSGFEVCSMRTKGCTKACLNTAGRGAFDSVQLSRINRTKLFFNERAEFMAILVREIIRAIAYADKRGFDVSFRLNATSDIPWHRVPVGGFASVMAMFPAVRFYDYTKVAKRFRETLPANYHLTFSLAEGNDEAARQVLALGGNVAAVFRNKAMVQAAIRSGFMGAPVIDGDETDLRYLDPAGVVVGLYAKGKAKRDASGFVRDLAA